MKKIIAVIISNDGIYYNGEKTINSLKCFNSNIKIIKFGTKEINELKKQYQCDNMNFIGPLAIKKTWDDEKPDLLFKIGADCLILDGLEDLIDLDFDVGAARNDPDCVGDRDERDNRPDIIRDIPNHKWVNADFIAIKNNDFVSAYTQQILDYWNGIKPCLSLYRYYKGDCQCALNVVISLGKFKSIIFDPKGSNVIYGSSGNWTGETDNEIPKSLIDNGLNCNNWRAWKYIYFNGSKCIMPDLGIGCGDRIVKCLHHGGGYMKNKMSWDLFNTEFQKYLIKITGFKS